MGQKVNAHGFRVGVSKPWDAKWYAEKDYAALLNEDVKIREFLKKQLYIAGVSRIEIERSAKRIKLVIHTAKPGMVIGRGGAGIEDIKKQWQVDRRFEASGDAEKVEYAKQGWHNAVRRVLSDYK